jgi:hypothetical protein
MRVLRATLHFVGALLIFSCTSKNGGSLGAYRQWMDDERHGVVVTKQIGEVKLKLQWLPPELLVFQDFRNDGLLCDQHRRDSVTNQYNRTLAFLLTVESANSEDDILWKNIATQEEFKDRVHQLNFRMNEFIRLEANGHVYRPILHALENDYGLAHARKIHLVFAKTNDQELDRTKQYKVVFEDELFSTGISQFVFECKNLDATPAINFWTCNEKKI